MSDAEQRSPLDDVLEPTEPVSPDRHEHAKANPRPDDEELERRTEIERTEVGLDDYDPYDVPPATDEPEE